MSSKLAPAKSRMTSEERREAIVQTACKLFSEKGFRGTTTRELAAAVGVTEPVLYEHFKTKRDLYDAIVGSKAEEGIVKLSSLRDRYLEADNDSGFFIELGNQIIAWYTHDPTIIRLLLFSSLEGHELTDRFHERSKEVFAIVAEYIERRIENGAMRPVDATIAGRSFFGMIAHYAMSGLMFGCAPFKQPPEEVVPVMVNIFLHGMCAKEAK